MELNILQENKNPLFNRKEIQGIIKSDICPNKLDVLQKLSEQFSVIPEAIRVLGIKGVFGTKEFKLDAHVYDSKEERDKVEKLTKKEKELETKKPEPEKTEEAKEEKPKPQEESQPENQEKQPSENK
jgi:ribosomal protein S24E